MARVADLDVKDYGTTNGMDVADPAAYVNRIMLMKDSFALIFVSIDPAIRQKMEEARLFYMTVAPEFPPSIASAMPTYRPDPLIKASFMKRLPITWVYNTKASTLLDGNGYEDVLESLFRDPMPHIISPVLNKQVVDQAWMQAAVDSTDYQSGSTDGYGWRSQTGNAWYAAHSRHWWYASFP